jgi:hypothetical protein
MHEFESGVDSAKLANEPLDPIFAVITNLVDYTKIFFPLFIIYKLYQFYHEKLKSS